jgi:hypothetical protein
MARDVNKRIQQLRTRRSGIDRLGRLSQDAQLDVLAKSLTEENWLKRAGSQPNTRYALGSMQEVTPEYTRISIETAERVGRQLDIALKNAGFSVDFRLQGSVPLNVHIRGVSDVDLLSLDTGFFVYATAGLRSQLGYYSGSASTRTSLGVLSILRTEAEKILKEKFPAATVDVSGGKAINISGGSLARPVDVVSSHWNDTVEYQSSGQEHDRGVKIFDKKVPQTIDNLPFLHIKRVGDRCDAAGGGLRKAIRLCKNVKSDAESEGTQISLPSFDIASTMYHADMKAFALGSVYELRILSETQRHLDYLACNHEYAKTLLVPDGTRAIFDTNAKLAGLNQLSIEMDDLAKEVAKEQRPALAYGDLTLSESRAAIESLLVS